MNIVVKTIPSIRVIFRRDRLTIPQVPAHAGPAIDSLMAALRRADVPPAGPEWLWQEPSRSVDPAPQPHRSYNRRTAHYKYCRRCSASLLGASDSKVNQSGPPGRPPLGPLQLPHAGDSPIQMNPNPGPADDFDSALSYLFADDAKTAIDLREWARAAGPEIKVSEIKIPESKLDKARRIWKEVMPQRHLSIDDNKVTARIEGSPSYAGQRAIIA